MATNILRSCVPALACVLLALSSSLVRAQPALAPSTTGPAPRLDPQVHKVAKSALERARKAWSHAELAERNAAPGTAGAAVTGEAAVACAGLVQAAGLITATTVSMHLHMARSGSIARYGNPYGMPAGDIAFPLLRRRPARAKPTAMPAPYPVPEPPTIPAPDSDEQERRLGRVYATYTQYHRETGLYYSGRTSAVIDLDQDWELQAEAAVRARAAGRAKDGDVTPVRPIFDRAKLDRYAVGLAVDYKNRYRDAAYLAIRGREQQRIDFHGARRARERRIADFRGGARSDTAPGEALTENAIRGVARDSSHGELFHAAANLHFGELSPYTGDRRLHE